MDYQLEEQSLELDAIDKGIAQYNAMVETRPLDELTAGKRVIKSLMFDVVKGIEETQRTWLSGGAVHNGRMIGPIISGIPAPYLALLTISTVLNTVVGESRFTGLAGAVGNHVDMYLQSQQMKQAGGKMYRDAMRHFKNINHRKFKMVVNNFDREIVKLSPSQRMHTGAYLLTTVIKTTDMLSYYKKCIANKNIYFVSLPEHIQELVDNEHRDLCLLRPLKQPMVVPPKDWTTVDDGGYLFIQQTAVKNIIGLDNDRLHAIREESLPNLLPYLNLLQKTAWTISNEQHEVLKHFINSGGDIAGIPRRVAYPFPPKPVDIETNEVQLKEWKEEASLVYSKNAKIAGQNSLLNSQIVLLDDFGKYPEIYFPWTADSRFRMYPSCTTISPQSSDVGKGMLKFAKGMALGDHGYKWLSISLCNNIGEDSISFSERVEYVHDHEEIIRRCVEDPLSNREWTTWDEPWKGLLTAREWVEAHNDKTNYISYVPVTLDGSCNGFQHYAALGRDHPTGIYTNLLPSARPDSLYSHVSAAAILLNEADCNTTPIKDSGGQLNPCHCWKGQIGKPLVKQPTMTTGYGVTSAGKTQQIYNNVDLDLLPGNRIANLHYARELVDRAIGEIAASAIDIMSWLKDTAVLSAKKNMDLVYTSPLGSKVVQRYPKFSESSIQTEFHRLYWRDPRKDSSEVISAYKQSNAIPPNYIHHLDAAHMGKSMMRGYKEHGIVDYYSAHDCFGTHAGFMEVFQPIIVEEFVDLHRRDLLEEYRQELMVYLGDIPPPPMKGTLDIEEMLNGQSYMFH